MKVALTGATGFLGRHFTVAALAAGDTVSALVRPGAQVEPRPGLTLVRGDLADREALRELVTGAEAVVHLAAVGVQVRNRHWQQMVQVNVEQPLALAEAAAEARVARLVAVGTCLEYQGQGKLPASRGPAGSLCEEQDPLEADEPYGAAKAAGGLLIRSRARGLGLPCWYLRYAAIYGPGDDRKKLLPAAARAARERQPFPMTAGEQVREWLHVSDAVAALQAAAATPPPQEAAAINVGTGEATMLREVVAQLFACSGAPASLLRPGALPYRAAEAHRLVMSTSLARELLPSWRPRVSLEQGLADLVETP
jgi:nucleoside-diphosphate-sugar epimerase